MTTFIFSSILLLSLIQTCLSIGLSCKDHPLYYEGMGSEMVKSFYTLEGDPFVRMMFVPRVSSHRYEPSDPNDSPTKYSDLSWFFAPGGTSTSDKFVALELQRPSKVYLMVGISFSKNKPDATLPKWRFEGHAELMKGRGEGLPFGVHEDSTKHINEFAVVFSRTFTDTVYVPNLTWIRRNIRGIRANKFVLNIAESDGSPPNAPLPPKGFTTPIRPMKPCPSKLHDAWVTKNVDFADPDTKNMMWPTWHPAWDPCFWCAYDHEHGSSPKHLGMDYEPRFGYTAYKNNRQDESHQGFKSIVFQTGNYMVSYGLHGQTSSLRRVYEAVHTISLTITDRRTKELLVDINHKADFGPVKVRTPGHSFMPLNAKDKRMEDDRKGEPGEFNFRTINVINEQKLNRAYAYRSEVSKGLYEAWTTNPMCSGEKRDGTLSLDFQGPATAIKSAGQMDVPVQLGFDREGKFIRQAGFSRLLSMGSGYKFGDRYCPFDLSTARAPGHGPGYFYTDPYGKELKDGPGSTHLLQFIKPGFHISIEGRYDPVETFTALSARDAEFRLQNYGFGLDPTKN